MSFDHRIVIGDWSHDGHNQEEYFTFRCSHDEETIQKAYLKAVKKCKIALHEDSKTYKKDIASICCCYEDNKITEEQIKTLEELGVDFSKLAIEYMSLFAKDIAILFFEMAKTQIEGFTYELIPEKKTINGFWHKDFNYGFGYGCFH